MLQCKTETVQMAPSNHSNTVAPYNNSQHFLRSASCELTPLFDSKNLRFGEIFMFKIYTVLLKIKCEKHNKIWMPHVPRRSEYQIYHMHKSSYCKEDKESFMLINVTFLQGKSMRLKTSLKTNSSSMVGVTDPFSTNQEVEKVQ